MTPEQEAHLSLVQKRFMQVSEVKYRRGQKEHGGSLFEKSDEFLLDAAIEEAVDQVIYLLTLKEKLYGANDQ